METKIPPIGIIALFVMKSSASRKSLPKTCGMWPPTESAEGTPSSVIAAPIASADFARFQCSSSTAKVTTTSKSDMHEVKAAMKSSAKNAKEKIAPIGICAKTAGSVTNVSPGPEPASMPNAKTAGKMTRPAMKATEVSSSTIVRVSFGMSSCEPR